MESKDNFEFPIDNSIPVTEWINFTTWTGKKICPFTYDESLAELLEESFRLYLVRILATSEETVVQCLR